MQKAREKITAMVIVRGTKMELIKKTFIADPQSSNDKERSITAIVSDQSIRDADGEIIIIGKTENTGIDLSRYRKNPVLCYQHRSDVLGTAMWVKKQSPHLVAKFRFSDKTQLARETYELYKEKTMRAFSLGFLPGDFDRTRKIYTSSTLLEISAVAVGSNEQAISLSYEKGLVTDPLLLKDFNLESFDYYKHPISKNLTEDQIEGMLKKAVKESLEKIKTRLNKNKPVVVTLGSQEIEVNPSMLKRIVNKQCELAFRDTEFKKIMEERVNEAIQVKIDMRLGKVY